jgi:hypothetical protein
MPTGVETHADPLRVWLLAACVYTLGALLLTWPLPARLFSHLPLGSLSDPVVPWFNLWTLEWNADRLAHGYAHYWNAPSFYPSADSFALSEPQGLTGVLFAPLSWLLGSVAAYNLTLESLLVLDGLAVRRWLRVAGVSSASATLAGALVLGLPFVHRELGVLQLCALFPVLFGFAELCRLSSTLDPWALVRLGLCIAAAVWTCLYSALFFATLLLPAPLLLVRRDLHWLPLIAAGVSSLLLVLCLCWPLLAVQRRAVSDFSRSSEAVHAGSASAWSYLQPPAGSALGRCVPAWSRSERRRSLFPGAMLFGLALVGARRARRAQTRRFMGYSAGVLVMALLLSFGTGLRIGTFVPYETLVQHVLPGYAQLRSPYRAAVFVQLFLVVFAGFGLDALAERTWRPNRAAPHAIPALCVLLALVEMLPVPQRLQRFPHEAMVEPWIAWLAQHPGGAVAMVPPASGTKVAAYDLTVLAMLQSLRHGHPIVNGYSGFFPPESDRLMLLLRRFPAPTCLRALRRHSVRYVVVDNHWAADHAAALQPVLPAELAPAFDSVTRSVFRLGAKGQLER